MLIEIAGKGVEVEGEEKKVIELKKDDVFYMLESGVRAGDYTNNGYLNKGAVAVVRNPAKPSIQFILEAMIDGNIKYASNNEAKAFVFKKGVDDPNYLLIKNDAIRKQFEAGSVMIGRGSGPQVGADPEIFITDALGRMIPAFEFLPEKKGTRAVGYTEASSATKVGYWDGFQAEFNIEPNACHSYVVDAIRNGLYHILNTARAKVGPKVKLTHGSSFKLSDKLLKDTDEKYITLGCAPSLNAYGEQPLVVEDGRSIMWRSAGCHIHYGYASSNAKVWNPELAVKVVKGMDAISGVIGTMLLQGLECPVRRNYYGRAGEYRLPAHGLEYRVPSSTTMIHPVVMHLILDLTRQAGSLVLRDYLEYCWDFDEDEVRQIINEYDIEEGTKFIKKNEKNLDRLLNNLYYFNSADSKAKKIKDMIYGGVGVHLPLDMEKNWKLTTMDWVGHSESNGCSVSKLLVVA